jgi:Protein of unknown function (DUF1579)
MTTRTVLFQARPKTIDSAPARTDAHDRLGVFLGEWDAEGRVESGSHGPSEAMAHTHTYRWLPGNFHIYHCWNGHIGSHASDGIEIIGYDAASRSYVFHFFDSDGWARTYQGHVDGPTWTLTGIRERCTMTFSDDGQSMMTRWERSPDGKAWEPLCVITSTKHSAR